MAAVHVDALLRDASPTEVTEGLERNPGSRRLAERQALRLRGRLALRGTDEESKQGDEQ